MGVACVSDGGGGGRPRPRGRSGMVPRIGRWSELMLLRCVETVEVGEKVGSEAGVARGLWMRSSMRADLLDLPRQTWEGRRSPANGAKEGLGWERPI